MRFCKNSLTNPVRFVIVCAPRTGSTLLHTYLNSHTNIYSFNEILREQLTENTDLVSLCNPIFDYYPSAIKSVGIKFFYDYFNDSHFSDILKEIKKNKDVRIIHLKRDNFLESFNSLSKAEKTGVWSSTKECKETDEEEIIDKKELQNYQDKIHDFYKKVDREFINHSMLEISYNDLCNQPIQTLDRVQIFLSMKRQVLFSILQKQSIKKG